MAVSVIGDIDKDGIADVAASAPYVRGGVVYICKGFRGGILSPEQVSVCVYVCAKHVYNCIAWPL